MKRTAALFIAILLLLSFVGCADTEKEKDGALPPASGTTASPHEQDEPVTVDDSLILLKSADSLTKPYENFLWAEEWTEQGWLSGDGTSVSRQFPDIQQELPQITYGDDFKIHYKDGVEFSSLSVYDSDFGTVFHNAEQEVLSELEEGTYYLVINVKKQGDYVESEEKYEYTGYECAYKLHVSTVSDENLQS